MHLLCLTLVLPGDTSGSRYSSLIGPPLSKLSGSSHAGILEVFMKKVYIKKYGALLIGCCCRCFEVSSFEEMYAYSETLMYTLDEDVKMIQTGHCRHVDTINDDMVRQLTVHAHRFTKTCMQTVAYTGPHSTVSNVSDYRYLSDCRSRGRAFNPYPVPYFHVE